MRNIKLVIEYDGTNYCGWQVQNNGLAIQYVLEAELSKLTGDESVKVNGSGRTDAGVHALGQTVNFHTESNIPVEGFVSALNSRLPSDVTVVSAEEVAEDWHARYSAVGKHYRYVISLGKSAVLSSKVAEVRYKLDVDLMAEAAKLFEGEHDFVAFMASGSQVKSTVRTVTSAEVREGEMDGRQYVVFDVYGNGFRYNMVRIMAGTLIDIGRGHLDKQCVLDAYESGERGVLGHTAPASGLYLVEVFY